MRLRDITGLVFALIAAVAVAYFTRLFLTDDTSNQSQEGQSVVMAKVLVAAQDLKLGMRTTTEDFTWQDWPQTAVRPTYFTEGSVNLDDFVGAVVRERVSEGEPVTAGDVMKPGDRSALSALIEKGMQAITVNVDAASASSGLLQPGDYVDVIHSYTVVDTEALRSRTETRIIARNLLVLAVGAQMHFQSTEEVTPDQIPQTVTLQALPSQSEDVAKANGQDGNLTLSVVSLADGGVCKGSQCDVRVDKTRNKITIIRGNNKTEVQI